MQPGAGRGQSVSSDSHVPDAEWGVEERLGGSHHFLVCSGGISRRTLDLFESSPTCVPIDEDLQMTTRLFPCAIAALLCGGSSFGDEPPRAVKDELKLLEGEWKVVAAEADGKPVESKAVVKFTADGKCTISTPGATTIETTITLDPTKEPKWMDAMDAVRKTPQKGIYELKGDKLRAVFQPDAKGDRPAEFSTKKKGEVMFTYERVKPK
jgi:uncharacterized protein (TIGR03067 family)